ncbi:hypothetical protein, partial [Salmonella sp. s54412]|uniref:hypothetical protein n=1 Tax=Salmonella sp. s54412 TaxID=3160128 RepID=UPI003754E3EB
MKLINILINEIKKERKKGGRKEGRKEGRKKERKDEQCQVLHKLVFLANALELTLRMECQTGHSRTMIRLTGYDKMVA